MLCDSYILITQLEDPGYSWVTWNRSGISSHITLGSACAASTPQPCPGTADANPTCDMKPARDHMDQLLKSQCLSLSGSACHEKLGKPDTSQASTDKAHTKYFSAEVNKCFRTVGMAPTKSQRKKRRTDTNLLSSKKTLCQDLPGAEREINVPKSK